VINAGARVITSGETQGEGAHGHDRVVALAALGGGGVGGGVCQRRRLALLLCLLFHSLRSPTTLPTDKHPKTKQQHTEVWSPSGGWWCDPKGWRRNAAVAGLLFLGAQYALFTYSAANERRYVAPKGWVASMAYTDAARYPRAKGEEEDDE
jgi:hypothetical protein